MLRVKPWRELFMWLSRGRNFQAEKILSPEVLRNEAKVQRQECVHGMFKE